jgi:hypothetical protein
MLRYGGNPKVSLAAVGFIKKLQFLIRLHYAHFTHSLMEPPHASHNLKNLEKQFGGSFSK